VRLHFLGGAAEVGASCVVVEADGRRVLVDAGIRMGAADSLPDLSRLQDLGGVDAVVVTHAHADHIGALPLAVAPFPASPVVATPATGGLMAVMLQDAVRIGEARAEAEGDLPAYGEAEVAALLERVRPLPFGQPLPLLGDHDLGEWQLTFFPAGHVLGAAMALLETPEGTILISGDVSIIPQATVGPAVPPRRSVDVLVLESTYGNRLHSQRAAEETRLIGQIQEIIARGGHCLIPAFALGRAQEILLILAAARRRGEIGSTPVWVDGLVRAVCGVYRAYAESGSFALRRLVERQGNPFFSSDGPARAVQHPDERAAILGGPPAIIVASSGMLQGGPSAFYAAKLAGDARHGILITGYQDEESPGRRLLDLAQAPADQPRHLILGGAEVDVQCSVNRYNLSAHADGDELAALADRFRPGLTLLVHGDGEARAGLTERLNRRDLVCRLPLNGETVEVAAKRSQFARPVAAKADPTVDDLVAIARLAGPGRTWTALELAERFYGEITAAGVAAVGSILAASGAFAPDRLRPMVYRLAPSQTAEDVAGGPKSQEEARRRVEESFANDPTFAKASYYFDERRIELRFHFPDVAKVRYADTIASLSSELGWQLAVRPSPDQMALQALARRVVPAGLTPAATASVRLESRRVELHVDGEAAPEAIESGAAAFLRETGYSLVLRGESVGSDDEPGVIGSPSNQAANDGAGLAADDVGKLELNNAFATIKESLSADGATIYRIAKRGEAIEVAFITPQVGERWRGQIGRLQESLGWPLEIARQPQQGALIELVRHVVTRRIIRGPGIHVEDLRLRVRLSPDDRPSDEELAAWQDAILEQTGYRLVVE
jgi:Cft2 family RNA processing exonuclease